MSREYTVIHQWDKVKSDFAEVMKNPYEYVEREFKKALTNLETKDTIDEGMQDLASLLDMIEILNTIYSPDLKN